MKSTLFTKTIGRISMKIKTIRWLGRVLLLTMMTSMSLFATTFVNIDEVKNHTFPQKVRELGIPVTLLHKHGHGHGYLVYAKDYKSSFYRDNVSGYNACSWHLDEDGNVIPYEYCEEKIKYDIKEIRQRLWDIQDIGYKIYGTTVRPITGLIELETEGGHAYVKENEMNFASDSMAETAINGGPRTHRCIMINRCVYGPRFKGHVRMSYHMVWHHQKIIKMIDDLLDTLERSKETKIDN